MTDPASTRLTILSISTSNAMVRHPNGFEELWSLASLPRDVQPGDVVTVQVIDGDLECWIEQAQGIQA